MYATDKNTMVLSASLCNIIETENEFVHWELNPK